MEVNNHPVTTITSAVSYATSAGLVAGKVLDFLNTNAAACGVILGFMTFLINWYYQHKSHCLIRSKVNDSN